MAAVSSIIAGIGLATAIAGQGYSAIQGNAAAKDQRAASERQERIRRQQMELETRRRQRTAAREAILARSQAVSAGVAQGAGLGGSGVLTGASGAIATGAQNIQTAGASQTLGGQMFDANLAYSNATMRGQVAQNWGGALSSLGGALISNAGTIAQIGEYYTNRPGSSPQPVARKSYIY